MVPVFQVRVKKIPRGWVVGKEEAAGGKVPMGLPGTLQKAFQSVPKY